MSMKKGSVKKQDACHDDILPENEAPMPSERANRRGSAELLEEINLEHHGPEWLPKPIDKRLDRLKKKRKQFGSRASSQYSESLCSFDVASSGRFIARSRVLARVDLLLLSHQNVRR